VAHNAITIRGRSLIIDAIIGRPVRAEVPRAETAG
jgi:hypothetical protein